MLSRSLEPKKLFVFFKMIIKRIYLLKMHVGDCFCLPVENIEFKQNQFHGRLHLIVLQ